jgi:hypothetical protein
MKLLTCCAFLVVAMPALAQRRVVETGSAYRAAPRLRLVETSRWCRSVDAPGCDFKNISEAIATEDGGLLVADYRGPIRRFDRSGAFTRELSRKGAGPGEYRYVHSLQTAGNQVAWYDPVLRRVTRILLASGQPGEATAVNLPIAIAGFHLISGGDLVAFEVPAAAVPGDTVTAVFRTVTSAGSSKVLATVRHPSAYVAGSPVPMAPPLFSPNTVEDVGWNGDVAHSTALRYDISVFPSAGSAWRLKVDIAGRPVLPAERDSAIAEEVRSSEVRNVADLPPHAQERIRRARAAFPQIETLRVVRDGTVWIRPTPARGATVARWDVFSREGRRIGFVELPLSATIKDGTDRWILASVLQEDDVPTVVRYDVLR